MPVWSYIGGALYGGSKVSGWDTVFNTSYQSIIGSDIAFVFGGGQITNVYGYTLNVQIDWEYFVGEIFGGQLGPGVGKVATVLFRSVGNSSLILGDNVTLHYYGQSITVDRSSSPAIAISPPKMYTIQEKRAYEIIKDGNNRLATDRAKTVINEEMKKQIDDIILRGFDPFLLVTAPRYIWQCILAGALMIFVIAFIARFKCNVGSVYNSSESSAETQSSLALWSGIISQAECSWIVVLNMLEMYTSVLGLSYTDVVVKGETSLNIAECAVTVKEKQIIITENQRIAAKPLDRLPLVTLIEEYKVELIVLKENVLKEGENLKIQKAKLVIMRSGQK